MFALQVPGLPGCFIERGIFARFLRDIRRDPSFEAGRVHCGGRRAGQGGDGANRRFNRRLQLLPRPLKQEPRPDMGADEKIDAPVLVIWGERDRYLGSELARPDRA